MFSQHPFSNTIFNALASYIGAFNPGASVPPTPKEFAKILTDQATAYGINWSESLVGSEGTQMAQAVQTYTKFYQSILQLPLPSNPQEQYEEWYKSTHPNG